MVAAGGIRSTGELDMGTMAPSIKVALAAGQDAGDRSARKAGRNVWVVEDWDEAARVVAVLLGLSELDIADCGSRD